MGFVVCTEPVASGVHLLGRTELSENAYFGWGLFTSSGRSLLCYLTAPVKKASKVFRRDALLQLLDLDVRFSARRQGLGTGLVEAACAHATSAGVLRVEVGWPSADPRASSAFGRAQGFSQYIARGASHC